MTASPPSLFKPVTGNPLLKVLLYGDPDTGKTLASLTFPRVALCDLENKALIHFGKPGIAPFARMPVESIKDMHAAVEQIRQDGGKSFDTLVVDSISVLYNRLLHAADEARAGNGSTLMPQDRARINRQMNHLYAALALLPVHLVVIAREDVLYQDAGGKLKEVGRKIETGGSFEYTFDYVINMRKDYSGFIVRETGGALKKGSTLPTVSWDSFYPVFAPWHEAPAKVSTFLRFAGTKLFNLPNASEDDIRARLTELKINLSDYATGKEAYAVIETVLRNQQTEGGE